MEIVHAIELEKTGLNHAIKAMDDISLPSILLGPCEFSFLSHPLLAINQEDVVFDKLTFDQDVEIFFSLLIVDEHEKKPLLSSLSPARSLWLLGEIVDGVDEGLKKLGVTLKTIRPERDKLSINFVTPKTFSNKTMLGAAMCLITLIDSLLFARGLMIKASYAEIGDEGNINQPSFFGIYKNVLTINA